MQIIPAVDIQGGKCVRLRQGQPDQVTIFSDDPVAMALHWQSRGAERLHVVDLDGAFAGSPQGEAVIGRMLRALAIPIQVGGGIRDLETIARYFEWGVGRVVLGTTAVTHPGLVREACQRFPGRVVVGLDIKHGYVAIRGWQERAPVQALALARELANWGAAAVLYTDIMRDGMLTGPNLEGLQELTSTVQLPVLVSGGIAHLDHIRAIVSLGLQGSRVVGLIIGRALYTGSIDLESAMGLVRERPAARADG